ncbi:type III secretion system protein SctP [Rubrivivax sp. RP6-9]|uniref:type III secretion system protein SctP n=1 Tax=Rubrivivax sp. RP6-9 TaxID=3415750 RepID=UPI003CC60C05
MAGTKPLPFERVRVIVDVHTGLVRRNDERRPVPLPRPAPQAAWRPLARPVEAAPPAAAVAAFAAALAGGTDGAAENRAAEGTREGMREGTREGMHEGMREGARPEAATRDAAGSVADGPPPPAAQHAAAAGRPVRQRLASLAERAAGDAEAAVPIAAIARSVQEATAMHAVAALVLDTCSGDAKRETGPWEFTLPLHGQGLGRTSLLLRLSRELLSLRFSCDGPDTRDLLSRHSASLLDQLQTQLAPPLVVDIVLSDA